MPRSDRPPPPTVLIVDDNSEVLDVLSDLVSNIGHATVMARTGVAGIALRGSTAGRRPARHRPAAVAGRRRDLARHQTRPAGSAGWSWSRPTSTKPSPRGALRDGAFDYGCARSSRPPRVEALRVLPWRPWRISAVNS